jgi:flagellar biosynthesis protein FlhG
MEQQQDKTAAGGRSLRVIAVTSGKGGVGKSNLTANLAVQAARMGHRVLVIDADLGLANVEILMGLSPRYHLGHVLDGMPLMDVVMQGPMGVKVLPGGSGLQALTRLDDQQKLRLTAALDAVEDEFDVVLIDSGAGIGENVVFFVGAAQQVLLVVSPEPTSLTDAYAAIKVLSASAQVEMFNVVVNSAPGDAHAREIYQRLCTVTARFLTAKLQFSGWVPADENVHRAVMAQRTISELFPMSPASRAMIKLAEKLLSEPPPQQFGGGLKFLWGRLLRDSSATAA